MRLRIDRLGARGDGIADTSDGPVYVPQALPGETVEIRKTEPRGDGAAATSHERVSISPDRIDPACPHFGTCGGCAVQHMGSGLYADWKRGLVETALQRAGIDADVAAPVTVPPHSRRRVRLAFRRTRSGVVLGFREARSERIVDVAACPVSTPAIVGLLSALRGFLVRFAERGEVAVTETETGPDVVVFAASEPGLDLRLDAPQICADAGIARLSWSDGDGAPEPVIVAETPVVRFGDVAVSIPPDSFLQPTASGESALRDLVTTAVAGSGAVADLYAGCGSFSLPLAVSGTSVHAVEAVPAQTAAMRAAGGHRGLTVETRDLARQPMRPAELRRFDAVVLDPPRAGAAEQVEQLAGSDVPLVVHVSCNPATFARDARTLIRNGYSIGPVQPVDQFLWSHHVELAAAFRRR